MMCVCTRVVVCVHASRTVAMVCSWRSMNNLCFHSFFKKYALYAVHCCVCQNVNIQESSSFLSLPLSSSQDLQYVQHVL